MRFTNILSLAAVMVTTTSGVAASAVVGKDFASGLSSMLSNTNSYGAPRRPWQSGCKPGWYYAHDGGELETITSLTSGVSCFHYIFQFALFDPTWLGVVDLQGCQVLAMGVALPPASYLPPSQ